MAAGSSRGSLMRAGARYAWGVGDSVEPSPRTDAELLRAFLADRDVRCPSCRYNLRGLPGTRCVECGEELELHVTHRRVRRRVRFAAYVLLLLLPGSVVLYGAAGLVRAVDPIDRHRPIRFSEVLVQALIMLGGTVATAIVAWKFRAPSGARAGVPPGSGIAFEVLRAVLRRHPLGCDGGPIEVVPSAFCPHCGDPLVVRVRTARPIGLRDDRAPEIEMGLMALLWPWAIMAGMLVVMLVVAFEQFAQHGWSGLSEFFGGLRPAGLIHPEAHPVLVLIAAGLLNAVCILAAWVGRRRLVRAGRPRRRAFWIGACTVAFIELVVFVT